MRVYKLVMRRTIMALLLDRLREYLEFPQMTQAIDRISIYEIDTLLYLRSDPKLDELRRALTRLDNGTFGICTECRRRIDWSLLLRDPGRRVCLDCDDEFRNPVLDAPVHAYANLEGTFAER